MTPAAGERYTVTPHKLPHGARCGRFHCLVKGRARGTSDAVTVQEIVPDGDRWRLRMSTCVYASALIPIEVDVDLFGNPVGPARRTTSPKTSGGAS